MWGTYICRKPIYLPTRYGGISTVHITTDNDQMDKVGEAAQTMSRATHKSAYTAMDYALKAQEINTKLLQQSTQAWIDGFRYQAKLSQGMAQVFFGQWENALASMPSRSPRTHRRPRRLPSKRRRLLRRLPRAPRRAASRLPKKRRRAPR